jgi:hypothetical protein
MLAGEQLRQIATMIITMRNGLNRRMLAHVHERRRLNDGV